MNDFDAQVLHSSSLLQSFRCIGNFLHYKSVIQRFRKYFTTKTVFLENKFHQEGKLFGNNIRLKMRKARDLENYFYSNGVFGKCFPIEQLQIVTICNADISVMSLNYKYLGKQVTLDLPGAEMGDTTSDLCQKESK